MKIFISVHVPTDRTVFDQLTKFLREKNHQGYPKQLGGFFGAQGLHDPDELDEHLRDEDLAIVLLSQSYLKDRWLPGELHALLTLENKLRPNFILPVFLENLEDTDIPEECLVKPHIDFRNKPLEKSLDELLKQIDSFAAKPRLSVFVSHSGKDKDIANALTDLMLKAFNLTANEVLCTSVEGHRLPLSANTDEMLRRMIREAKVFVCIATNNSIGTEDNSGSFYVAAELGARWGMKRYLALLLAGGATGSWLKAPFTTLNALSCEDHAQVQQFIRQISPVLGRDTQPAESYFKAIEKLVTVSKPTSTTS